MSKTIKQLEEEIVELKIKQHKDNYIHIPKVNIYPLLGLIFFGILSYLNLKLLDWELIKVVFSNEEEIINQFNFQVSHLINIYPIVGEYILVILTIISFFALIKGGYNQLKIDDKNDLISFLIVGLTCLIFGLISFLIFGLISFLIIGWISFLIVGLTCLIFGLTEGFD